MSALTIAVLVVIVAVVFVLILLSAVSARIMIQPGRNRPWSDPQKDQGLAFETVKFRSQDGVPLEGWFIGGPAGKAPTVVILHGWPWCRMGTRANNPLNDLPGSKPVSLMPLAHAYHDAGYHVFMYDASSFGVSGTRGIYTSGWLEARDLLGALDYLTRRPDVDSDRIVAIGFSFGGNSLIFGLSQTDLIRAAIAVQPTTPMVFGPRYGRDVVGPIHRFITFITQLLYSLAGGPNFHHIQPALAAVGCRGPLLLIQGTGDKWGSVEDVANMAAAAPGAVPPLYPETGHRFDGYKWVVEHPAVSLDFFAEHLRGQVTAPAAARMSE